MFPSRFSYRARARSKNRSSKRFAWISASSLFAGVLAFYCLLFPEAAGTWGAHVARFLTWLAGVGSYVVPLFVVYLSTLFLFRGAKGINFLKTALALVLFWSALMLLTLVGNAVWQENFGGILGFVGHRLFSQMFGEVGSWIMASGLAVSMSVLLAGKTPSDVLHHITAVLREDWQEWRKAKAPKTKTVKAPVVAPSAALTAVKSSSPKIMNGAPPEVTAVKPAAVDLPNLPIEPPIMRRVSTPAMKSEPAKFPTEIPTLPEPATAAAPKTKKPYTSPALTIFDEMKKTTPVGSEELTTRAKLLEQTLANFSIAARVVEIHPGPVITRYDLEPAPGVKVSSIASRLDDLALAMRSTGMRVLAPIPGKGAVGVEIPNLTPESVGLRELMARPEFYNHPSPLAFVLGKTVSGEPYIVDLAAMPHMLIAGATGSGKSVCVHALISSILYRMPPDRVKFAMIDPKRLELPGYSGIPHLYDPRVPPLQAEVITNSKQAAKALMRLVKVMEYRYDLFAKANVRNIDSYNRKRKEAGLPPEYFLVVIIDELADLMLTSPKEVEDSVQRLAQMARAVGIHLVLATQRPSVDVITGVIKANLPARIALRVASTTDSRVIIDTGGAESLLGKGDMLFLPPASAEPVRVQGAYVSEREVENLVGHVKQFGLPEYDDLFSSGSALEFAVEDKKEMKDLIEAIKLVLERKRVSQDLLKAHFGSSARATNILSLLEVKEFIKKPEGTNRWEINFDLIEDFLSKVNNIPDQEMME